MKDLRDRIPTPAETAEKAYYGEQPNTLRGLQSAQCVRPGLRERVNDAFYRAERESRKCDRLKELAELLDSNPAIARILELIEASEIG